jgi:hypothetical protein
MKKSVVAGLLILLAISAIAQGIEVPWEEEWRREVKRIKEEVKQEIGVNLTEERLEEELRERMRERLLRGEVEMNITPYLLSIPVFPPMRPVCPPFMILRLPYKAYMARAMGYVMRQLKEQNLTLPQVCADRPTLESFVRTAIEEVNLTWICKGLEEAAERCREAKPITCERIELALERCVDGFRMCKRMEKRVIEARRELWRERLEALKERLRAEREAMRAIEEMLEQSSIEIEIKIKDGYAEVEIEDDVELEFTVPTTELRELISEIVRRAGLPRSVVEAEITIKYEKPPVMPMIEGVVPKCHMEELFCEHLKEELDRCKDFKASCAPQCDVISNLATECVSALADMETLISRIVDFLWKRCELLDYLPPDLEEVEQEVIPPAEIQPVIIATDPNLTPAQEASMEALVEELKSVAKDDVWIYRAFVRADRIEDLRELEFVRFVKLDHFTRAVQKKTFKELPDLPDFAPPTAKVLPYLESVKERVEEELQPIITESQAEVLTYAREVTEHHKEERARGIGYAILKLLGLQARREQEDAAFLEEKARAVSEAARKLGEVAEVEKDVAIRALILEQVAELHESVEAMTARAIAKRKRAWGIWSWLFAR